MIAPRKPMHKGPGCRHRGTADIDVREVFEDNVEGLVEHRDGWAWGHCPFHDDRKPSFCVNLESAFYRCHSASCGLTGSGLVSFVSDLLELEFEDAADFLERNYG